MGAALWMLGVPGAGPAPAGVLLAQAPPSRARLAFVGDIMLGRHISEILAAQGMDYPFRMVAPLLLEADLAFGNMESPLTTAPRVAGGYDLRADPDRAEAAALAGFDLLSLANNHATDNGRDGLLETMDTLRGWGMATVGAGENLEAAQGPWVTTLHGLRLAFFAYDGTHATYQASRDAAGCMWLEPEKTVEAIGAARPEADIIIVSVHWGEEYQPLPNAYQRRVAQQMADAGADIIVGHHPHVVEPVEWIYGQGRTRPTLVAFSLGNFLFDQWFSDETMQSAIMMVDIAPAGVEGVALFPVVNIQGQAQWADPAAAEALLSRLLPDTAPAWEPLLSSVSADRPALYMPAPADAPSSAVDLDGDGQLEEIILQEGQLHVREEGNVLLLSPPEWEITAWAPLGVDPSSLVVSVVEPPVWAFSEGEKMPAASFWDISVGSRSTARWYVLRWDGAHWRRAHRSGPRTAVANSIVCAPAAREAGGAVPCLALEGGGDTAGITLRAWENGRWSPARHLGAGQGLDALILRDLDGDGRPDVLACARPTEDVAPWTSGHFCTPFDAPAFTSGR